MEKQTKIGIALFVLGGGLLYWIFTNAPAYESIQQQNSIAFSIVTFIGYIFSFQGGILSVIGVIAFVIGLYILSVRFEGWAR